MRVSKILFLMSSIYIALLLICIILMLTIIPGFNDVGHLKQGCYFTDAIVPYIKCTGFFSHKITMFVLNIPYQLIYLPLFGVFGFLKAPWVILLAVLVWAPLVYYCFYLVKNYNNKLKKI